MREFHAEGITSAEPHWSIPWLLHDRLATHPDAVYVERRQSIGGGWTPVTVAAFAAEVVAVAKGLVAHGVEPGDRVALMAKTRYEWTLLDYAIWFAGGVGVPIYETSSPEQVRWICADAGVRLAIVETPAHAHVVGQVRDDLPGLAEVLVIDEGAVTALVGAGRAVPDEQIERRSRQAGADDLATIIYTSGTTGRPKGVELTHGNFVSLALNGVQGLGDVCASPGARTLMFMPLAHVFARYLQVVCLPSGAVIGHSPSTRTLLPDLDSFKPTFVLAVPRVFEKVYNSAEQSAGSGAKLRLFRWSAKAAVAYSHALDEPSGPSLALRAQHRVADTLVHRKVRAALGGALQWAVSGGAPLGERLGHFYRGVGVRVLEGYGLTETCAPTTVNRPGLTKVGTVGPAFPGTAVRIDDDGQVLISGPHVFRAYRHDEEATRAALQDGWFRTGDLGALDDDGYLTITGRSKEIIVTAGGKNVAPAVLEDALRGHPLVSQVVVVGDQRPFIGALVTLDAEMLPGWLANHGLPSMDVVTAGHDARVLEALDRAVERANEAVSRAESIRKIRVLPTDFTEANGYLTPSLKVKRSLVLKDFATDIDELYVDTRADGNH